VETGAVLTPKPSGSLQPPPAVMQSARTLQQHPEASATRGTPIKSQPDFQVPPSHQPAVCWLPGGLPVQQGDVYPLVASHNTVRLVSRVWLCLALYSQAGAFETCGCLFEQRQAVHRD
jgi:hypothetical protein